MMKDWVSLPLRIGLGLIFLAHGLQKAFGLFGGSGIVGFSKMLAALGFSPALAWAYLAAYLELIGGLFLLIGLWTRISSGFLLILILVATVKVHLAKGFFIMAGGFEYNFLIICGLVGLLIYGPGKLSITKKF